MKYVLGFDISGTKSTTLLAGPGKEDMEFLERKAIPIRGTWKEVLNCLADKGKVFLGSHRISGKECCIGISCEEPLDSERDVILSPPNLPDWDQVPIMSYLEQRLDTNTRLKNDADAYALAEQRCGAGRGCRHMIFLTFGTGLGTGLVLNRRLCEEICGMAGGAGHVRLAEEGPVGYEKTGSFGGFCNKGGIARLVGSMTEDALEVGRPVSYMKEGRLDDIIARDVAETTEMRCADAGEVLAVSGQCFGRGLAILVDILNPEKIVARGIHARAGRFLKDEMERELRGGALPASVNACCILPYDLGEQIGDYGAVMAALGTWEE